MSNIRYMDCSLELLDELEEYIAYNCVDYKEFLKSIKREDLNDYFQYIFS